MKSSAKHKMRRSKSDLAFDIFNYVLLGLAALIVLYPLYFVVIDRSVDGARLQASHRR